jgi:hypothetical protein
MGSLKIYQNMRYSFVFGDKWKREIQVKWQSYPFCRTANTEEDIKR